MNQAAGHSGRFLFTMQARTLCLLFGMVIFVSTFASSTPAKADDIPRHYKQAVVVVITHWQLARWSDGGIVCDLYLQHQSWPSFSDVSDSCGLDTAKSWQATPICQSAQTTGATTNCKGLLLRQINQSTQSYSRQVDLPEITMRVVVSNCIPGSACSVHPEVEVKAYEPLPGYQITQVHVRIGDRERIYDGSKATIRLPLTTDQGSTLTYWAESNFGDKSSIFQVKFRARKENATVSYKFDLLNDEWQAKLPGGALLWGIFPPSDGSLPQIFEQPVSATDIATTERYIYLAGYLIRKGLVDVTHCQDYGLLPNGSATPCGERAGMQRVQEWQNRYDQQIYVAAQKYNLPARVLKAVIAQESQFIPESNDPYELGLGHITENGIDMLLMWNIDYYLSLCTPAYRIDTCSAGYSNLGADQQMVIRGSVVRRIGTNQEIDVLAAMLYASAAQTRQMLVNVAHTEPSAVSTYEDLWKLTVANYYSGSGCISTALKTNLSENQPFLWGEVSTYLLGDCQIAKNYVRKVLGKP